MRVLLFTTLLCSSLTATGFFQTLPGFYDLENQERISDGVSWKKLVYDDLFGKKEIVNLVTVDLSKADALPLQKKGCQKISKTADSNGALVAINGGFFKSGCVSRNLLKVNNKIFSYNVIREKGSAALLMDENGKVEIRMIASNENPSNAVHGLGGFPLLVSEGAVNLNPLETTSFYKGRHPRTVVATKGNNQLLLITVDGRRSKSKGLNLQQLAEFLVNLGVDSAMNLDGGGSTMMWVQGQGIVNTPSDGNERSVSDGLGIFN